jgi:hypothetical protein
MSYNITSWKTNALEDLWIPVPMLCREELGSWKPERDNHDDGTVTFSICEAEVFGRIVDDTLEVKRLRLSGEGSGYAFREVWGPALKASTGKMSALIVWEGGDSIERYNVVDGEVTSMEVT